MSKQVQEAYVVAASRTPVGKAPRGCFKTVRPEALLVHAIQGAMAQVPDLDPKWVEDAIVGCAMQEAEQAWNLARMAVLYAGLPQTVAGATVNRLCASGLTSIAMAADRIRVGEADVMIAGGCESMSMVPMAGNKPSMSPYIFEKDENYGIAYGMGLTAEQVAKQWQISREMQDAFAFESHKRAVLAQEQGAFNDEIVPFQLNRLFPNLQTGKVDHIESNILLDEGPRPDSSLDALAQLRPIFAKNGSVTAGNSSQTSDGAGALILVSEKMLKQLNLKPLARFVNFAIKGVPPEIMGIGPKFAIPFALQRAGLSVQDMDWIELNEAFAAQALAVMRDLDLDPAKVNPNGGAIALGHPLGATGSIRAATTIHALQRHQLKYGMVTMCVGIGMGAAAIFERM